mgnify:FL=1
MLVFDSRAVGNKLLEIRKKRGLTQVELAELAGLADRTYADIERGSANMRVETALRICEALQITPNEILTAENHSLDAKREEVLKLLQTRSIKEQEVALNILSAYLNSI